jgi:hypothetical protein
MGTCQDAMGPPRSGQNRRKLLDRHGMPAVTRQGRVVVKHHSIREGLGGDESKTCGNALDAAGRMARSCVEDGSAGSRRSAERPSDAWDAYVYASGRRRGGLQGWAARAGRRQRLVGMRDPGGECRLLFGVGDGPAEAIAGAKQGCIGNADRLRSRERLAWKSRLVEVVPFTRESASFLRQSPVVNHLSFTCSSTC